MLVDRLLVLDRRGFQCFHARPLSENTHLAKCWLNVRRQRTSADIRPCTRPDDNLLSFRRAIQRPLNALCNVTKRAGAFPFPARQHSTARGLLWGRERLAACWGIFLVLRSAGCTLLLYRAVVTLGRLWLLTQCTCRRTLGHYGCFCFTISLLCLRPTANRKLAVTQPVCQSVSVAS